MPTSVTDNMAASTDSLSSSSSSTSPKSPSTTNKQSDKSKKPQQHQNEISTSDSNSRTQPESDYSENPPGVSDATYTITNESNLGSSSPGSDDSTSKMTPSSDNLNRQRPDSSSSSNNDSKTRTLSRRDSNKDSSNTESKTRLNSPPDATGQLETGDIIGAVRDDSGKKKKKSDGGEVVKIIKPPDGGWGWVVVFSSFLIHVIADGIVYSFGVFLMEFVEVFKVGRGPASWIGALQPGVTFTVGPLASALTNRYGCRPVTCLGALVAGVGFIISIFATDLYYLYFTCGIMAGVGFGLIYLPAIVSIAQYFETKRSFATGLAVCGSGVGTFLLAPATERLVQVYNWKGAMLILGGVILNVIICGLLFRPLEGEVVSEKESSESDVDDDVKRSGTGDDETRALLKGGDKASLSEIIPLITRTKGAGENEDSGGHEWSVVEVVALPSSGQDLNKNHQLRSAPPAADSHQNPAHRHRDKQIKSGVPHVITTSDTDLLVSSIASEGVSDDEVDIIDAAPSGGFKVQSNSSSQHNSNDGLHQISASQCLSPVSHNDNSPANLARSDGALHRRANVHSNSTSSGNANGDNTMTFSSPKSNGQSGKNNTYGLQPRSRTASHGSTSSHMATLSPLSRKDVFYRSSLTNIPMYNSKPDVYLAAMTPAHSRQNSTQDRDDGYDKTDEKNGKSKCFNFSREFRSAIQDMMSFSLLKNPVFLMFAISNFLTSIGFNMPFIFLPDRAKVAGIPEDDAALLLSVIGIANTAGRIIFGFMSDRPWVNRLYLYNSALTICGLATALSTQVGDSYIAFVIYAAVFGLFIGVYVTLTSVVLVDLLGLEYLTNSFGLLLLFQGAATFVGPPIAGELYDWTGSYDISFIVMGIMIAVSGAMLFVLPWLQRRQAEPVANMIHQVELGRQVASSSQLAQIMSSREIPTVTSS